LAFLFVDGEKTTLNRFLKSAECRELGKKPSKKAMIGKNPRFAALLKSVLLKEKKKRPRNFNIQS
jgi:hypothetical protein